MASVDKNQAMIDFLITCPVIQNSPLFFNFAKAKEDNNQFILLSNDIRLNEPYIDGSVLKQYKFILVTYKSLSLNPIVKVASIGENQPSATDMTNYPNENLAEIAEFQAIIDWVNEQAEANNFPNFGSNCIIDSMRVLSDNPSLYDVDESVSPPVARYSISIQVDYLDNSLKLWQNKNIQEG